MDTRADAAAEPPEAARLVFGDQLPLARRYAGLLSTDGVVRGLLGPREAPRLWDRHLLNCAVVEELIPDGASVMDVGSGAGLPGIVLAIVRPDLNVTLVDSMVRRTDFLDEAVDDLGLAVRVRVVRARAEERPGKPVDVVTARALAPLDRLAAWCLPLVVPDGRVLALKGESAADEVAAHRAAVRRLGGAEPAIRCCGGAVLEAPTTVVEIVKERSVPAATRRGSKAGPAGSRDRPAPGFGGSAHRGR
jgi:16S rRNA (guanine527-N7)-methyltransferase